MALTLAQVARKGGIRLTTPTGIIRCERVWKFDTYRLKDYLLWVVLDGVGKAWYAGAAIPLGPGTCLLLPPGPAHDAVHDPERRLRVFYLHADLLDGRGRVLGPGEIALPPTPVLINDLVVFESLARLVVEGAASGTDEGRLAADLALRLALLRIHDAAGRRPKDTPPPHLSAALVAVRENPGAEWSVERIASLAGLSVSHTSRRVRELTGAGPRQYVIHARVERARRLMEETSLGLDEIARSLGYNDVYFFSRQFKSVTGMSPGRWRKARAAVPERASET